jgi:hypothetical protein
MASSILNRLQEIRDDYARRRTLWRELSAYQTTDALNDLEAAITRSETEGEPETQEMRRILAAQRIAVLQRG